MALEQVLFQSPWIPYAAHFFHSRITLTYPENVIFTAQLAQHLADLDVYRTHPYAEKVDLASLDAIDWTQALVVLDRDLQLLFAPVPVQELVRLDRRLHYRQAADVLFAPFRLPSLPRLFHYQWLGLFLLWALYAAVAALASARYRDYSLALPSTPSVSSPDPPDP